MDNFEFLVDLVKKNWMAIVSIAIAFLSVGGSILYVNYSKCPICDNCDNIIKIEEKVADPENKDSIKTVKVDIKGAVKKPGVYELNEGSNIDEAIKVAGGITSKATTQNINLSKRLKDEMVIYVFTKDEIKKSETESRIASLVPKCECETIKIENCIDKDESKKDDSSAEQKKISINKATKQELSSLDGIGESKAEAIIDYRTKNGDFKEIEDLKKVSGIGEVLFEKIKDKITI